MTKWQQSLLCTVLAWQLSGCALLSDMSRVDDGLDKTTISPQLPAKWQLDKQKNSLTAQPIDSNGLIDFIATDESLQHLMTLALAGNQSLQNQRLSVEIQAQRLSQSNAALWPSLSANVSANRRKANESFSESYSQGLGIDYELDLWGKLAASEQQANLQLMAATSQLHQTQLQLQADILTTWFDAIAVAQILVVYQERVKVSLENLAIIESGYQQGLNSALDVYLTRNELNSERALLASQQQSLLSTKRRLARLAADVEVSQIDLSADLPALVNQMPVGVPSDVIKSQPALQVSWYQMLGADANLAFAHKRRFPSLTIRGSADKGGSQFQQIVEGDIGWSLLANLTAPIFDAGRLKAEQKIAALQLRQAEQNYLNQLYQSLTDAQTAMSNESSLVAQLEATQKAQQNADSAMKLSFEQYRSGLVSYTTVLDAQNRAYSAKVAVIRLKNQLLANRIKLHLVLGGQTVLNHQSSTL